MLLNLKCNPKGTEKACIVYDRPKNMVQLFSEMDQKAIGYMLWLHSFLILSPGRGGEFQRLEQQSDEAYFMTWDIIMTEIHTSYIL